MDMRTDRAGVIGEILRASLKSTAAAENQRMWERFGRTKFLSRQEAAVMRENRSRGIAGNILRGMKRREQLLAMMAERPVTIAQAAEAMGISAEKTGHHLRVLRGYKQAKVVGKTKRSENIWGLA
jgi:N-acetylneuraminic acid mutarotase